MESVEILHHIEKMKVSYNKEVEKLHEEGREEIVAWNATALESQTTFVMERDEAVSQAIL